MAHKWLSKNGLTAIIIIAVILFVKKIFAAFSPGGLFDGNENKKAIAAKKEEDLQATKVEQVKMSKTLLEINRMADVLHNAMDGPGTNEGLIFETLRGLNTEDLKALYKAFGLRDTTFLGVRVKTGNLFDWFQDELSNEEYTRAIAYFNGTGLI